MLFAKAKSLRDVIAFPKVASGRSDDRLPERRGAGAVGGAEDQDAGLTMGFKKEF